MKITITEGQLKNIINEALGVPESILEAAEDFYEIFLNKIKTINVKSDVYDFQGHANITLGSKDKIRITGYELTVEVDEYDEHNETAKIYSMGMKQNFVFDRTTGIKKTERSASAEFKINYVVNKNWKPEELYEELFNKRNHYTSILAHELKHKYDKQIKKIDIMSREADYFGATSTPRFGIKVIDNEFLYYLYYTDIAENLVRTTEVASRLRSNKVTQEQFMEFLSDDDTFKQLLKIKNFTFDDLRKGILENKSVVNRLILKTNVNPFNLTDEGKVNVILNLLYVNLVNTKIDTFESFIKNPMDNLLKLFSNLGVQPDSDEINVDKVRRKYYNQLVKFQNNPIEYFKYQIKEFHYVANKIIKKIGKLYAMTPKNTTESILDWELNEKIREKKGLSKPIDFKLNKRFKN